LTVVATWLSLIWVKTTIVIADPLLKRAQRFARARGITLRALVEDGLRRAMEERVSGNGIPDAE
jgi:hypothetical protein